MPNMSYCRFQNTVVDLQECYDALCENEELSELETKYAQRLVELCKDIAAEADCGDYDQILGS